MLELVEVRLHFIHLTPLYPIWIPDAAPDCPPKGIIELFRSEFPRPQSERLGTSWRNNEGRRSSDWQEAAKVCPEWTEDRLQMLLDGDAVDVE